MVLSTHTSTVLLPLIIIDGKVYSRRTAGYDIQVGLDFLAPHLTLCTSMNSFELAGATKR